jgi:transglycosylase-like protein with SLT domain
MTELLSTRVARFRRAVNRRPLLRLLGGRGALTLLFGAALSIGGMTDTLDGVHFLVEKNLDSVLVVRQRADNERVVAKLNDGFAANTVFKLSQILPDRLVSRQLALFDDQWLPQPDQKRRDVFFEEIRRINDTIRQDFFSTAIPYGDLIHAKAAKYDVDPALVAAVMEQESRFKHTARSPVGAQGLMQLMPRTGRWMGARDLYDPEQNVDAGVKYIKYLQKQFGGNLKQTVAAYNAGEGNVKRYGGVPPFRETQSYVKKVLGNYQRRNRELERYRDQQSGGDATDATEPVAVR